MPAAGTRLTVENAARSFEAFRRAVAIAAAKTDSLATAAAAFSAAAANAKNGAARLSKAGIAADDLSFAAAHLLPRATVEGMTARCRECGKVTPGAWQYGTGGRVLRTPTEHPAPSGGTVCDGSFAAAVLTNPEG